MKMVMPKMGMTMEEGTIVEWKKRDGDYVKKGEVILEIMTNKVNMDLEAPASGYLKISRRADEAVPVGEAIADIEESLEEGVAKPAGEVVPVSVTPITPVPKVPVSVTPGAREFPMKPVTESEISEKRVPASPRARLLAEENRIPLDSVTGTGPGGAVTEKDVLEMIERKAVPTTVSEEFESGGVSPLAERIARQRGVDLTKVRGTGIGGKITKEDVMTYLEGRRPEIRPEEKPRIQETPEVKRPPVVTETRVPEPSRMPETRILEPTPRTEPVKPVLAPERIPSEPEKGTHGIPLRGIRKLTAERMLKSKKEAPHLTLGMEVDMTEASKLKDSLTVTYTDIVVKAAALALKKHPMLNSTLKEDRIVLRETINIGIAVARGEDLLVPVIHNADKLSLREISRLTKDIIDRTKSDKLTDKDVLDGTFTLSNLGMYDIDFFTPIINPPEAAILGVGKIEKKPVIVEDKIEIRWRVTLSLSFDHRIINGMPASLFLKEIKDLLEHPYKLLVEGEQ